MWTNNFSQKVPNVKLGNENDMFIFHCFSSIPIIDLFFMIMAKLMWPRNYSLIHRNDQSASFDASARVQGQKKLFSLFQFFLVTKMQNLFYKVEEDKG